MLIRLLHFEYLSFDEKTSEVFIPNREIAREFYEVSKSGSWDEPIQALECSDSIVRLWRTWTSGRLFLDSLYFGQELSTLLKWMK